MTATESTRSENVDSLRKTIRLDCYGINTYIERELDRAAVQIKELSEEIAERYMYDGCSIFDVIRSTKNIYFPADFSEPVTYWDITESDDIS